MHGDRIRPLDDEHSRSPDLVQSVIFSHGVRRLHFRSPVVYFEDMDRAH